MRSVFRGGAAFAAASPPSPWEHAIYDIDILIVNVTKTNFDIKIILYEKLILTNE
jgi:hypothetical protein